MHPAAAHLVGFTAALRGAGFAAAPSQGADFLAAVGLLGPRSMADLRAAARAVFGPGPERRADFEAVFDAHFLGRALVAPGGASDETPAVDDAGPGEAVSVEGEEPAGAEATAAEALRARDFAARDEAEALRRLRRAGSRLPQRLTRRRQAWRGTPDLRRAFREAARRDGEVATLPQSRRRLAPRRVLLLIDVSGSMKAATESNLRAAHALARATGRVETFTLGTRLTRVTRALGPREPAQALARAAGLVADWDGGTRLGEALAAFLRAPRFAALARGAVVVVVSDGLERGEPDALVAGLARLSRLAWRLVWLTPLPGAEPRALTAARPCLDALEPAPTPAALCDRLLSLGRVR